MTRTPEEIAAGLTEAQRRALLTFCARVNSPYGYYASDLGISGRTMHALWGHGLVVGVQFSGRNSAYSYRWTERGKAVATILEKDSRHV